MEALLALFFGPKISEMRDGFAAHAKFGTGFSQEQCSLYYGKTDAQCDALRAKADEFEVSGKPISEAPQEIKWIIARRKSGRTNGRGSAL